jgi:uncharacterized membrane protein
MKFEQRLKQQIKIWLEEGIITQEQVEQMTKRETEIKQDSSSTLTLVFGILGAVLIGGGLILIFARNWSELPVFIRTFLAFLPLLISQALTIMIYKKKLFTPTWREGVGVFYSISILACVALISQIYQLSGEFSNYLLGCSLLILPICYVLDAGIPAVFYIVGITSWMGAAYNQCNIFHILLLTAPIIPYFIKQIKNNPYSGMSQIFQWAAVICGFVIWLAKLTFFNQYFLMISLYFTLLFTASLLFMDETKPIALQPAKLTGGLGNVFFLYFMAFFPIRDITLFSVKEGYSGILTIIFLILAIVIIALFIQRLYKDPSLSSAQTALIGLVFPWITVIVYLIPATGNAADGLSFLFSFLSNIYLIIFGIVLILTGIKERKVYHSSLGTANLSLWIFIRFF